MERRCGDFTARIGDGGTKQSGIKLFSSATVSQADRLGSKCDIGMTPASVHDVTTKWQGRREVGRRQRCSTSASHAVNQLQQSPLLSIKLCCCAGHVANDQDTYAPIFLTGSFSSFWLSPLVGWRKLMAWLILPSLLNTSMFRPYSVSSSPLSLDLPEFSHLQEKGRRS